MTLCQYFELNEKAGECGSSAELSVTYPTGALGPNAWNLCITHYSAMLRVDQASGEMTDFVQEVKYLVV